MWELVQERNLEMTLSEGGSSQGEEVLAISVAAVNGSETPKTARLKGIIQGIEVMILID